MKSLIRHAWYHERDKVVSRAIKNCNVRGLHKIPLVGGSTNVTLFVATSDHKLWCKGLPFHCHAYDSTFEVLIGEAKQCQMSVRPNPCGNLRSFIPFRGGYAESHKYECTNLIGNNLPLPLDVLSRGVFHTIMLPKYETAAWLCCSTPEKDVFNTPFFPAPGSLKVDSNLVYYDNDVDILNKTFQDQELETLLSFVLGI